MYVTYFDEVKADPRQGQNSYWVSEITTPMETIAETEGQVNELAKQVFGSTELTPDTEFHCKLPRHPTTYQFGRERRQQVILPVRPAVFDRYVLAIDVTDLLQSVPERDHRMCVRIRRRDAEKSDHR